MEFLLHVFYFSSEILSFFHGVCFSSEMLHLSWCFPFSVLTLLSWRRLAVLHPFPDHRSAATASCLLSVTRTFWVYACAVIVAVWWLSEAWVPDLFLEPVNLLRYTKLKAGLKAWMSRLPRGARSSKAAQGPAPAPQVWHAQGL